ncbi:MAG: fasciclin domain-containing protein [Gammaproteobacteria bacterium]|nr:fasciclin domain-containing protein [Gammaproteobacteria bacterium]
MNLASKILVPVVALTLTAGAVNAGHHKKAGKNIVETAAAAGQFETLIAAAKAAGLAGALSGDGPLTVFAPTDDAFNALPAGTIASLLKPENKDALARILKYHVLSGRVGSEALADGVRVDTLAGPAAKISEAEKGFTIEGARIVATDIDASNGVVHVIDRVIMPPETMSRRQAAGLINAAIERGVPMFNHGNADGTAMVYSKAARALLGNADLTTMERNRLELGLSSSERSENARESAWQLRYALDDVMDSMMTEERRAMATN